MPERKLKRSYNMETVINVYDYFKYEKENRIFTWHKTSHTTHGKFSPCAWKNCVQNAGRKGVKNSHLLRPQEDSNLQVTNHAWFDKETIRRPICNF
jgi:hypothetical protein